MASCIQDEEKRCRLCLEGEDDGPLVQPCACRGSAKLAHSHCLERWRRTSPKQDAAYRCGQCRGYYLDALSLELLSARLQVKRTNGENLSFTLDVLASELKAQGKLDEAEPLYREGLEMDRGALGDRHPNTLFSISNLGTLLYAKGDLAAAEPLQREALVGQRETHGNRHQSTLISINGLGMLLYAKDDLAAAEPLLREALELRRETLGNRHPSTLTIISNLGMLLQAKGDLAAAEVMLREALEGQRETLGSLHPSTLTTIGNLDQLLQANKDDLASHVCYLLDVLAQLTNDPTLSAPVKQEINELGKACSTMDNKSFFSKLKELVGRERIKRVLLAIIAAAADLPAEGAASEA